MTDKKKPAARNILDDPQMDVPDLPPIVDDEVPDEDPSLYIQYVDETLDEPDREPGESEGSDLDMEVAEDLIEIQEGSWMGEEGDNPENDMGIPIDENDEGWAQEGSDDLLSMDDNWFEEESPSSILDDGGQDGPVEDGEIEPDRSGWEDLDEWEEEEDAPIEEVMDQLGIGLSPGDDDSLLMSMPDRARMVIESQFLGPLRGSPAAIDMTRDGPFVVGNGIFRAGADGMFHRSESSSSIQANSVCSTGNTIFIGTRRHGALVMSGSDGRMRPINGWNHPGTETDSGPVDTSFAIMGQKVGDRYQLIGCAKAGQIFMSADLGRTWSASLTEGSCLAACVVQGTTSVLVLESLAGKNRVIRSDDLLKWHQITLPADIAHAVGHGPTRLAACEGTILIAVDAPSVPLFCSMDNGDSWFESEATTRVTAMTLDPEDPGWIAAAAYRADDDLGMVRICRDGGRTWNTVLVTGRERHANEDDTNGKSKTVARGRVLDLAVVTDAGRTLYVVANEGVHKLTFSKHELEH